LKLQLNDSIIQDCFSLAGEIAGEVSDYTQCYTTVGIERAVLRLLGVEGANEFGIPYVNVVVDYLKAKDFLQHGAAFWLTGQMLESGEEPVEIAQRLERGEELSQHHMDWTEEKEALLKGLAIKAFNRIQSQKRKRDEVLQSQKPVPTPWKYVIVATGNIHIDVQQAAQAVNAGADVIAVIRSTAQSLLDYVPEGLTTEGYGGTYATQQNFALMRDALDKVGEEKGRYGRLVNYASGLCMAEMAVLGGIERLDMMLSDSMYGILFRDINPVRTFIDQQFARRVQGYAGMIINTGEDNYLTTADAFSNAHTVLASQFINYAFAKSAGLQNKQIGLGNAHELDPAIEDNMLLAMGDALLSRQCFPNCPLKYMPPTKHINGNIFQAHVQNAVFNLISTATEQHIHLVGMLTEAIHTPFPSDRFLALQNTDFIFRSAKSFAQEFEIKGDGIIQQRANKTLEEAHQLLAEVQTAGLLAAIENGMFAQVSRTKEGGRGRDGVCKKSEFYQDILKFLPND